MAEIKKGKVAREIERIQIDESLTLPELFEKYPYLAKLQLEELLEEKDLGLKEEKKLLLD